MDAVDHRFARVNRVIDDEDALGRELESLNVGVGVDAGCINVQVVSRFVKERLSFSSDSNEGVAFSDVQSKIELGHLEQSLGV